MKQLSWMVAIVLTFLLSWFTGVQLQQMDTLQAKAMQIAPCDVIKSDCVLGLSGSKLKIHFNAPVNTMSPFSVVVESAAEVTQVTLQFRMQGMEMAVQRYRLLKNKSGTWQAEVMLPVCSLGRSDWVALLDVQLKQEWWRGELVFRVGELATN